MKIVYLTKARLPNEHAHGVQTARMCEALAGLGGNVTLLYAAPIRLPGRPPPRSVLQYYDVKSPFDAVEVPYLDVDKLDGLIPRRLLRPLQLANALVWNFFLGLRALRYGADLFVTRDQNPLAAWMLAATGRRLVIEFHNVPSRASKHIVRSLVKQPGVVAVFAVTEHLARQIEGVLGMPEFSVTVLHDAVDIDRFIQPQERRNQVTESSPTVVYAGSMKDGKGVDTLVRAAAIVPDVRFSIVGGNEEEVAEMRSLAERSGAFNVHFEGYVPPGAVPNHLHSAAVLVFPMSGRDEKSAYNVSALKMFEYMATGIPIVASDLPGVREVLSHEGSAFFVRPDDPEALAAGVRHVLSDRVLAEKIATGAARLANDYTWKARAAKMLRSADLMPRG